ALERLVLAALVVRTLERVAMRIPRKPARAERQEPDIKAMDISQLDVSLWAIKPSNMATQITNMESTRYSALRNANAPSAMCLAIFFMVSSPASCLFTHKDFIKEK